MTDFGLTEIDHLVWSVRDAEAAGQNFERLGFVVSPISRMSGIGVENRLVLFSPQGAGCANFLEAMAMYGANTHPAMKHILSKPECVRWVVLTSSDATRSLEALRPEGIDFGAVMPVERDWTLPSGEVLKPAFRVTLPVDGALPFNFLTYNNLEPYLRPAWFDHPNGARMMTDVLVAGDGAPAAQALAEKLINKQAQAVSSGVYALKAGAVGFVFMSSSAAVQRYGAALEDESPSGLFGCRIQVGDRGRICEVLSRNGVRFYDKGERIVVPAKEANGGLIEFHL